MVGRTQLLYLPRFWSIIDLPKRACCRCSKVFFGLSNSRCKEAGIHVQCMTTSATSKAVKLESPNWTNFPLGHPSVPDLQEREPSVRGLLLVKLIDSGEGLGKRHGAILFQTMNILPRQIGYSDSDSLLHASRRCPHSRSRAPSSSC